MKLNYSAIDFHRMNRSEKEKLIMQLGFYIKDKTNKKTRIAIYKVNDFFVEATYTRGKFQQGKILNSEKILRLLNTEKI